jgi:NitT/TauT family transport system permease protein
VSDEHFIRRREDLALACDVRKPMTALARLSGNSFLRRSLVVIAILLVWEFGARSMNAPLILPSVGDTLQALVDSILSRDDGFASYVWESMKSLLSGFVIGSIVAAILTVFAVNTRIGEDFLATVTSAFAPLPAVAIFPLAMMWFGISFTSIVFITTWATVFPVAVAMFQGFRGVSPTLRSVGRNVGLRGIRLTVSILIPAALPSIMTGLRSGFSNAFRALVALEMVIGAATGAGGLGWFVMAKKQNLEIPSVFAGILAIMAIGLVFEALFGAVERATVRRWGMLR